MHHPLPEPPTDGDEVLGPNATKDGVIFLVINQTYPFTDGLWPGRYSCSLREISSLAVDRVLQVMAWTQYWRNERVWLVTQV